MSKSKEAVEKALTVLADAHKIAKKQGESEVLLGIAAAYYEISVHLDKDGRDVKSLIGFISKDNNDED